EAAASRPNTPYVLVSPPSSSDSCDCSMAGPDSSAALAGGVDGEELSGVMYAAPTTITSSTTPTLMRVITRLTRAESWGPSARSADNAGPNSPAAQAISTGPYGTVVGTTIPATPDTTERCTGRPLLAAAAATPSCRSR